MSVEGEKEGPYKDEGGVYRNTRPLCTAAPRHEANRVTRITLGRLVCSVITSGLIQKFDLYSVFPSST
jgi:hypothetical protein